MPTTISLAYTSSINTNKPSPTLTLPQVWAGLQHKIRSAQSFVPAIISTDVIEERTDEKKGVPVVVREVVFKEGNRQVREECWEWAPCKVDFHQPNGSTITNTISSGPNGADDLHMTYAFEWQHPELDAKDTDKVEEQRKKHMETATMAVEKSIEAIRRMVVEGSIKV